MREEAIRDGDERREKRLRRAGVLILGGLAVEILCLGPVSPVAFVIFTGLGGLAIAGGVFMYLHALIA